MKGALGIAIVAAIAMRCPIPDAFAADDQGNVSACYTNTLNFRGS
jgi:hypothetical protein